MNGWEGKNNISQKKKKPYSTEMFLVNGEEKTKKFQMKY
jgi:hypothetical protein